VLFVSSKLDFPRVVKFKARKQHRDDYIPKAAKVGRMGGKVILTFNLLSAIS